MRVGLDLAARATRVAHVLCAVKLDLVSRVERVGDQLAMLQGERGDYEKGRPGAHAIESIEYPRSPREVRTVVEGQRSPWGDTLCSEPHRMADPSSFVERMAACFGLERVSLRCSLCSE